jgi:hypothetical protein
MINLCTTGIEDKRVITSNISTACGMFRSCSPIDVELEKESIDSGHNRERDQVVLVQPDKEIMES